ncbi:nitrilase family protein [Desulfocucumis palustris]|nr:nitrilase family protein [Desulfocucumis palustris]
METTRIALVQMQAETGKIESNINKIRNFTSSAARQKVDIICFPELCVQGYHREQTPPLAEPVPGKSSLAISRLSREEGVIILAGIAEKSPLNKPYITQLLAFPDGRVEIYRKTHLGRSEMPYFSRGEVLPVFSWEKARLGVQICWDLHFPEVSAILSLKGAEIIFAPHASPTIVGDRRDIWLKYLSARAYDNTVFLAACNLVGGDGTGQSFCGGTMVIDPKGNVLAEDFNGGESMLIADLDSALLNKIRRRESGSMRHSFYLEGRRPELYGDLLINKD